MLHVGTDLSYPEEQIVTGTPFELAKMEFAPLAVLLFETRIRNRSLQPAWQMKYFCVTKYR